MSSDIARVELQPGRIVSFRYPAHNFRGVPLRLEQRRLRIDSVRDTDEAPLEDATIAANQLQQRSRFLVTGLDIDNGAERTFYDGAMRDIEDLSIDDLAVEAATLPVAICEGDSVDRITDLPDPRAAFCREFNRLGGTSWAMPYPSSLATAMANSSRLSE